MANQGKDFSFKASLLNVITCSRNCLFYVLWLHVLSQCSEESCSPAPRLCGWGELFFIIKSPKLIYLLFFGALVIAVLWIPSERLRAPAVYGQVEH